MSQGGPHTYETDDQTEVCEPLIVRGKLLHSANSAPMLAHSRCWHIRGSTLCYKVIGGLASALPIGLTIRYINHFKVKDVTVERYDVLRLGTQAL